MENQSSKDKTMIRKSQVYSQIFCGKQYVNERNGTPLAGQGVRGKQKAARF